MSDDKTVVLELIDAFNSIDLDRAITAWRDCSDLGQFQEQFAKAAGG